MVGKEDIFLAIEEERVLKYSVRPSEEPSEVFYTDQGPTFELHIRNLIDQPVEIVAPWFIQVGNEENRYGERQRLRIEPGSEAVRTISPNLLGVQASGFVTVKTPHQESAWEVENGVLIAPDPRAPHTLYTFSVWDRDFYKANYIWPRRAQFASALLAVLIVLVGIISILLGV